MAKKKNQENVDKPIDGEVKADSAKPEGEQVEANVEAKVELSASVKVSEKSAAAADEAALDRVLKALNISKAELEALEAKKEFEEEMVDYDITPIVVSINGNDQPCKGRVTRGMAEQILSMAAMLRDRMMQEALGKEGQAILRHGTIQAVIVPKTVINVTGQVVSQ